MPKPTQMPPLTWTRAFCEAARHGSFKAAADALGVSPSTISHEIRKLEDWVKVPLFDRTGRSIQLTKEGIRLFNAVLPAFENLASAFEAFAATGDQQIRLGVFPFLASEFLVPRLSTLENIIQGRALRMVSTNHLSDLSHPDPAKRMDGVIRYGIGPAPGFHCLELTNVTLVAVISGSQNTSGQKPKTMKRVHVESSFDGWKILEDAGVPLPKTADKPIIVDNYVSCLRAVEQGLGIGIALLPLAVDWIADNRLQVWSEKRVAIPERYWLVRNKNSPHAQALDDIGDWIRDEFVAHKKGA